jgi:WD40 repeat protein
LSNFPEAICDLKDKKIISGNDLGEITVHQIGSDKPEWKRDVNSSALEIIFIPFKKQFLIGTNQGKVYLLDQNSGKTISSYHDHSAPISCIALDDKEENFVSCGLDGRIVSRNLAKKAPNWILGTKDYDGDIEYLEFSPDSKKLLGSGKYSNVILIDSRTGASNSIFSPEKGLVLKAKWLPEKNYFSILNANGILSFVEAKSGVIYKVIRTNLPSTIDFDFSKDGKKILLTTDKGSCSLRELPDDDSIIVLRPDEKIERTPDFYFAFSNSKYSKYAELGLFLKNYAEKEKMNPKNLFADSPQDNLIATVHDGALRLWSKQTGDFITTVAEKLASEFSSCRFTKDGASLVGELESGHILIYGSNRKFITNTRVSTDSLELHPFTEQ